MWRRKTTCHKRIFVSVHAGHNLRGERRVNDIFVLILAVGITSAVLVVIAGTAARISTRGDRSALLWTLKGETTLLPPKQFDAALTQAFRRARKHGTYLSLIRVEIDTVSEMGAGARTRPCAKDSAQNGSSQHETAERMGAFLQATIRETDILTRLRGGGFAILTPGYDESTALKLTDTLRRGVRFETHGVSRRDNNYATCCFGVASLEQQDDLPSFRDRAESALRHAQRHGSNRIMGQSAAAATAANF